MSRERLESASVSRALAEVTALFAVAISVCKLVYHFRYVAVLQQSMALIVAAVFLYVPLGVMIATRRSAEAYGITMRRLGPSLGIAAGLSMLVLPAFVVVYSLYQNVYLHQPVRWRVDAGWWSALLFHFVCVAFPEEVFYRGYMQSRLNEVWPRRHTLFGVRVGIGLFYTAALFALGHFLIAYQVSTLATFFPGVVFGWLRERTGGIVAPIVFHALCNGTVLLLR